ncbi:hypothetical protein ACS2MN_07695 [Bacillus cereus group sp. BceL062]|uniref:hypothetical protein n=1 Tax=Bacillus cereus group TaxID=86661 RepID=UPI00321B6FD9
MSNKKSNNTSSDIKASTENQIDTKKIDTENSLKTRQQQHEATNKTIEEKQDEDNVLQKKKNIQVSPSKPENTPINNGASKKKTKISQGDLLEFRAKRLLFHMGYFPTRGIKLRTSLDEYGEDITDLDVYGIYIHKDFRSKSVWIDCKSGAAKPLERISWIMGIKQNFKIDDVLFIKNGIRTSVKHFSRKSGIEVLDLMTLEKIEKDYRIESNVWMGSWNPSIMLNKINEFTKLSIPNSDIYKRIANFISYEYWQRDSFTKLKKCITALRELSMIPTNSYSKEEEQTFRWGVYQLTTLFILAILNIAKEVYYYNSDDRRKALHEGILSSDIPLRKRTEILQAAYKLAFEMVKSKYPDSNLTMERNLTIQPPDYFEQLLDLLSRIIDNPNTYYDILRTTDFILMEYQLLGKKLDTNEIKSLCTNFDSNYVGIKTFLHFIHQVTNIPKDYFNTTL